MRCDAARARLLEVDDPRNGLPPELTAHLAECRSCRRAADRISDGLAGLAQTIERIPPPFDQAEAIRWARTGQRWGSAPDRSSARRPGRHRAGWPRTFGWGAASTAAVVVMVALWISERDPAVTEKWSPAEALPTTEPVLAVEVPEGARVAVFQTQNPNISVVWLY